MHWWGGCGHYLHLVGGEIHVVRARGPNQMWWPMKEVSCTDWALFGIRAITTVYRTADVVYDVLFGILLICLVWFFHFQIAHRDIISSIVREMSGDLKQAFKTIGEELGVVYYVYIRCSMFSSIHLRSLQKHLNFSLLTYLSTNPHPSIFHRRIYLLNHCLVIIAYFIPSNRSSKSS